MLSRTRRRVKVPLGASIKSKDTTPQCGASCPCFILLCAALRVDSSNTLSTRTPVRRVPSLSILFFYTISRNTHKNDFNRKVYLLLKIFRENEPLPCFPLFATLEINKKKPRVNLLASLGLFSPVIRNVIIQSHRCFRDRHPEYLIVGFDPCNQLIRDIYGCTGLHCRIQ